MTMIRNKRWAKGLTTSLVLASALMIGSAALAIEPASDPGRINIRRPDILLARIAWQDRTAFKISRDRFQGGYIGVLEQRYGRPGEVSRSNLLNSPAARYFTRILTGRRGR